MQTWTLDRYGYTQPENRPEESRGNRPEESRGNRPEESRGNRPGWGPLPGSLTKKVRTLLKPS